MNNEEFQDFESDKVTRFWWAGLFFFVLSLAPLSLTAPSDKTLRARAKAEVLAYQVAQLYRENVQSSSSSEPESMGPAYVRHPATAPGGSTNSSGIMGRDPWGRPYRYLVQETPDERLQVEMTSAGPDGEFSSGPTDDDVHLTLSF